MVSIDPPELNPVTERTAKWHRVWGMFDEIRETTSQLESLLDELADSDKTEGRSE